MKFWKFILYTSIGAGLWNCVLATLGWYLHSFVPLEELNDKIEEYNSQIQLVVIVTLALVAFGVALWWYLKKQKTGKQAE